MAELKVDPAALKAQAAMFTSAADMMRRHGAAQNDGTEDEIAALGEINAALHPLWRQVRSLQAAAWARLADGHDTHAEKLGTAAVNYTSTDDGSGDALSVTDL